MPRGPNPPLATLTVADVQSAYSGRPGCCCGCVGTHYFTEAHRAVAEQRCAKVNDREVKRILRIVQASPKTEHGGCYYSLAVPGKPGRVYIVYPTASQVTP